MGNDWRPTENVILDLIFTERQLEKYNSGKDIEKMNAASGGKQ